MSDYMNQCQCDYCVSRRYNPSGFPLLIFVTCVVAMILLVVVAAVQSDEPPRYTVVKPEPIAITQQPIDLRPVIYVYSTDNCAPCAHADSDIKAGKLQLFRFEKRAAPNWVTSFPTFHFEADDRKWKQINGYATHESFIAAWQSVNHGSAAMTAEASVANSAVSTPLDIFRQFAGDTGRVTFTPDQPIRTTLSDGTVVSYRSITGKYDYDNGHPTFTFDGDKPQLAARKFLMKFGMTLNDLQYDPPSSASVGTSRGRFTIHLREVK